MPHRVVGQQAPSFHTPTTDGRSAHVAVEARESLSTPASPTPLVLNVNGRDIPLTLDPRVTLLDALREYAGLTGSKKGCDHGQCGACTVHVDGRRVLSCLIFAVALPGRRIATIEGLADCGYCTSGQLMSAAALLTEPCGPDDDDVREAMSGNICRCGAYPGVVAAVQAVRRGRRA
jgi:xanthine dehydrogenase YagT iron-sulfur-binding subunit